MHIVNIFKRKKKAELDVSEPAVTDSAEGSDTPKDTKYWVEQFNKAAADKNREEAEQCLLKAAECCPNKHGYCLTELFCPECPIGGTLCVQSGRAGM